jgi:phenylacetate-coenzyme A ligase PaaK-like adenylate-forming protein
MRTSHLLRNAYESCPYTARLLFGRLFSIVPNSIKFGKYYYHTKEDLEKMNKMGEKETLDYQITTLRNLLISAKQDVPYYKNLFKKVGIAPAKKFDLAEFEKIPLLTRDMVRNEQNQLLKNKSQLSSYKYSTTAGTSGKPLGFYVSHDASAIEWAYMLWNWSFAGFRQYDKRIVLRGNFVQGSSNRFYEYDPIRNALNFSSFNLNEENLEKILEKTLRYRPDFFHAYPSTAIIFAQYLERNKFRIPSLKALLLGSENLLLSQKKYLEKIFNCRVYSWYGHSEKCVLAGNCDMTDGYWPFPFYGYTEIVDKTGKVISEVGKKGRIVGTSFINDATIFIRYLTDDEAEWGIEKVNGVERKVLRNIIGRWDQEVLVGKTGAKIPIAAVNIHSKIYTKVSAFQFYQEEKGRAVLRIIKSNNWQSQDLEILLKEFSEKLSAEIELEVEFVDKIPKAKSGKFKFIEQKLVF